QSVARLGQRGINTILGFSFRSPSIEDTRRCRDEYFAGLAAAPGTAAGEAGRPAPRFGIMRNIYVGESDQAARDRAIEAMEVFYRQFTAVWRQHGDPASPSRRTSPAPSTRAGSSRVRPPPSGPGSPG